MKGTKVQRYKSGPKGRGGGGGGCFAAPSDPAALVGNNVTYTKYRVRGPLQVQSGDG